MSCSGAIVGNDDGEHVAEIRRAPADGDHHRPVLVDEAHPQHAGDVGGGEHGSHTRHGFGGTGVNGQHVGTGMVGEPQCAVCHTVGIHVVDVRTAAQRELAGLVADAGAADALGRQRHRHFSRRQ